MARRRECTAPLLVRRKKESGRIDESQTLAIERHADDSRKTRQIFAPRGENKVRATDRARIPFRSEREFESVSAR